MSHLVPSTGWLFYFSSMQHRFLLPLIATLAVAASRPATAQCDGTEIILHTFTAMWNDDMQWELHSASGEVLASYEWAGDLTHTYDTLCVAEPCGYVVTSSIDGDGWGAGTVLEVLWDGGAQELEFSEGELGYHVVNALDEGCTWEFEGCTDPDAVNYTIGATADNGSCDYISVFPWDGDDREYLLHIPPDLGPGAPLVMCMHGLSGTMEGMRAGTLLHELADEFGFAVCWPQGSIWVWDASPLPYWNANLFLTPVDDIGFLTALAQTLQDQFELSPECTYACGASNGGMMSYTLISERPDVWKGMATVGGVMSQYEQQNGTVGPPRPVYHLHGDNDTAMPYYSYDDGFGPWTGGWGVMEMMEFWAAEHGHTQVDSVAWADNVPDDGLTETVFEWTGGPDPAGRVVHHRVEGGGHDWWGAYGEPSEVPTSGLIWTFFADLCENPMGVAESAARDEVPALLPYPNPVERGAQWSVGCTEPAVYDFNGRRIEVAPGTAPRQPGVYWVQCADGSGARVVVE